MDGNVLRHKLICAALQCLANPHQPSYQHVRFSSFDLLNMSQADESIRPISPGLGLLPLAHGGHLHRIFEAAHFHHAFWARPITDKTVLDGNEVALRNRHSGKGERRNGIEMKWNYENRPASFISTVGSPNTARATFVGCNHPKPDQPAQLLFGRAQPGARADIRDRRKERAFTGPIRRLATDKRIRCSCPCGKV